MFRHDMHAYCQCGHHSHLRAEGFAKKWQADDFNLTDRAMSRFRCTKCGRLGRPKVVTISPIELRTYGMGG